MTFHEILLQERKRRGLSQEELAGMVNVSRQAVSKWETGDAMPDLNKLLALADALDMSLDALCGRNRSEVEGANAPSSKKSQRKPWLPWVIACTVVIVLALVLSFAPPVIPRSARVDSSASPSVDFTKDFTVSGLNFSGKSGVAVAYRFTPSISSDGLTYQIIFTDYQGNSYPVDALCNGGVCSGEATLPGGYLSYGVTVRVTDGSISRNVAVAHSLEFSLGHASWKPIDS